MDDEIPLEPEAFTEGVARSLRRKRTDFEVEISGPKELLVNGRRLDVEDVYRMVKIERERAEEIVNHYLDQLFSSDNSFGVGCTIDFARSRIMPRIQPTTIFEHLDREFVAHIPFVNDTAIVYVLDLPEMTNSITTEQLHRWGVDIDEVEDLARQNLDGYASGLEVQFVESKEGGRAAIISEQDGYDAARLLLSGLHGRLSHQLGGDFYVVTPARDMFVALSRGPGPFIERLNERVKKDYERLPYPITPKFFLATQDGVAGTIEGELDDSFGLTG